jgi:hypothetical protein
MFDHLAAQLMAARAGAFALRLLLSHASRITGRLWRAV